MHRLHRTSLLVVLNLLALTVLAGRPGVATGQEEIPPQYYQPCCKSGTDARYCCTDCCSKKTCESNKQCNILEE